MPLPLESLEKYLNSIWSDEYFSGAMFIEDELSQMKLDSQRIELVKGTLDWDLSGVRQDHAKGFRLAILSCLKLNRVELSIVEGRLREVLNQNPQYMEIKLVYKYLKQEEGLAKVDFVEAIKKAIDQGNYWTKLQAWFDTDLRRL